MSLLVEHTARKTEREVYIHYMPSDELDKPIRLAHFVVLDSLKHGRQMGTVVTHMSLVDWCVLHHCRVVHRFQEWHYAQDNERTDLVSCAEVSHPVTADIPVSVKQHILAT